MAKKLKKKDTPEKMLEYTYRDMGQEFIMRRKMWRAIVIAIALGVALVVFVALYINAMRRVQETYRAQLMRNLENLSYDIEEYMNADGDFELRYRMLVSDMTGVDSFAFLLEDYVEEQKSINELYTCFIKYPEQMREKLPEVKESVDGILNTEDDAFEKMDKIVESIDKKGF